MDGLAWVYFLSLFVQIQDMPAVRDLMMELSLCPSHQLQLLPFFLRKLHIFLILHRVLSLSLLDVLDIVQHLSDHRRLLRLPNVPTRPIFLAIPHVEAFQGLTHVLLDLAVHLIPFIGSPLALGFLPGYGNLATVCSGGRQGATPALILRITPILKSIFIGQQTVNEIGPVLTLPCLILQAVPLLPATAPPTIDLIPE